MEIGYYINRVNTPLEKIDWKALKLKGITEVYIRCAEENLDAISAFLPSIVAAGLKPYAWTWQGFTMIDEAIAKGWHINADIEVSNTKDHLFEIKHIRCATKAANKTFILCTHPDYWNGEQNWDILVKYCDYLQPMLYLGDYNKTLDNLKAYMEFYNNKYPGKIYPALETYESDKNVVAKSKAALDKEIETVKPYCKGVSLFRYGISNFDNTPIPSITQTTTVKTIDKTIQQKLKDKGYYTGTVDGILGTYTIMAIKAFQKANGLLEDGIVGPITKAKLFEIIKTYPSGFTETNGLSIYRQTTGYTCGPASLKMALSRYGFYPGEMTLASYAGSTSYSGSTHNGLINATKRITSTLVLKDTKLSSIGWDGVYNYIKSNVPVIAHIESFINVGKSGHYVIIFGIDMNKKLVKLGDPSYGIRTVSFNTMETKMNWVINTGRSSNTLMPLVKN